MPPSMNLVLGLAFLILASCSSQESDKGALVVANLQLSVPTEITVKQRTTTVVRGSEGELLLTIDDVTRNQVMASLAHEAGELVMPTRSMSPRDATYFRYGGSEYVLTLKRLDNELIGDDTATFVISPPNAGGLTEEKKIEVLISAISTLTDAKFIRNGAEHSATEAADHLRTKWEAARDRIATADEFIEQVASNSSLSGEPYQIKKSDGTTLNAGDFLREKLATMQSRRD